MKKQIVKKLPEDVVDIKDFTGDTELYYGVNLHGGDRAILMMLGYCNNQFKVVSTRGFTHCNGWTGLFKDGPLNSVVSQLLDRGYDVYEFETFKELADWLVTGK